MAKFLKGNELNAEIEKLFESATEQIIIISPYIKLHDRYKSVLKSKMDDYKVQFTVVFGKNDEDMSRSMKQEDFDFFKQFPNIEIRYEKLLHAKYYASERGAILTSMNLYSFSQDNNIEVGAMTKAYFGSNKLTQVYSSYIVGEDKFDNETWDYFMRVIDQSVPLFQKNPIVETAMFGLTNKYVKSVVEVDKLTEFFAGKQKPESNRTESFEKKKVDQIQPIQSNKNGIGFCIRTRKQIPFNIQKPFCDEAYLSWSKYSNKDYKEKYCHFSGDESNGATTFAKPILTKYWSKAKAEHNF